MDVLNSTIGFIGTGNMGSALIKGIINSGAIMPEKIFAFDKDEHKIGKIAEETSINVCSSIEEVIFNSKYIIICVKPNIVQNVLNSIKNIINGEKVIISIAVGIPIRKYTSILGNNAKIVRTMPNTPALVGQGATLACCTDNISEEDRNVIELIFKSVGILEFIDEKYMNEVTALTGSSPAYVFMFIEAMADAAVLSGLPRELSYKLAAQAVMGAARLVLETGFHPAVLKDQVCSPGGTTIEAVASLEKNGFRSAVIEAMNECTKKARAISKTYDN